MAYVYFLYSLKDKKWYIGFTALSPEERLMRHNQGSVKSTKNRRPLVLAYYELYQDVQSATKREWHLKHSAGYQEKLKIIKLIQDNQIEWPILKLQPPCPEGGPLG
jgi:putative endonuclease